MIPAFRIGNGFDVHRFASDRELWLCGVKVDHDLGLLGHRCLNGWSDWTR